MTYYLIYTLLALSSIQFFNGEKFHIFDDNTFSGLKQENYYIFSGLKQSKFYIFSDHLYQQKPSRIFKEHRFPSNFFESSANRIIGHQKGAFNPHAIAG